MQPIYDYLSSVKDKRILISGGTTGIGRATALMLHDLGARVMVIGRNQPQIDETLEEMDRSSSGAQCFGVQADLAEEAGVQQALQAIDDQLGGLDILINNAALGYGSVMEGSYQDWQYIVNTNLLAYLAMSNGAISKMTSGGHIVNIGSLSADVREKDSSVYVATKAGIQGFSEALRKEVNEKGIKVSLIEPGAVDTDMQEQPGDEKKEQIKNEEMLEAKDIAMAVVFCLCQPHRSEVIGLQIRPHLQII
ncbi:oxidoreductase [Pedobacter yulinensis]|uniref:Oxidoreductase n=1 Tax=Pedobacter yulinensis TaxID=2126353 RepID=A0A2T3HMT8_9SPHI|nr:SDR family oxidoreductase [Pedobacter yulinensis]PST83768.1 oxidoreductase [Pedobacter yulinensis]